MKVLIGDTIFDVSYLRRDRHFTWSSEPRNGLAICKGKAELSFLSYFKTVSIATFRFAVKRSTEWANRNFSHGKECISWKL